MIRTYHDALGICHSFYSFVTLSGIMGKPGLYSLKLNHLSV